MYCKIFLQRRSAMETILMDVRRFLRSILDLAHARSDVQMRSGRKADTHSKSASYRSIDAGSAVDVYGRRGRIDIYSGKEAFEFYKKISFDKMPPL